MGGFIMIALVAAVLAFSMHAVAQLAPGKPPIGPPLTPLIGPPPTVPPVVPPTVPPLAPPVVPPPPPASPPDSPPGTPIIVIPGPPIIIPPPGTPGGPGGPPLTPVVPTPPTPEEPSTPPPATAPDLPAPVPAPGPAPVPAPVPAPPPRDHLPDAALIFVNQLDSVLDVVCDSNIQKQVINRKVPINTAPGRLSTYEFYQKEQEYMQCNLSADTPPVRGNFTLWMRYPKKNEGAHPVWIAFKDGVYLITPNSRAYAADVGPQDGSKYFTWD